VVRGGTTKYHVVVRTTEREEYAAWDGRARTLARYCRQEGDYGSQRKLPSYRVLAARSARGSKV